jgi:hypothetical protein
VAARQAQLDDAATGDDTDQREEEDGRPGHVSSSRPAASRR